MGRIKGSCVRINIQEQLRKSEKKNKKENMLAHMFKYSKIRTI